MRLLPLLVLLFSFSHASDFGNILTAEDSWIDYGCKYSQEKDCAGNATGTMGKERKTVKYFCRDDKNLIQKKEVTCTSRVRVKGDTFLLWHGGNDPIQGERFCFTDKVVFSTVGKEGEQVSLFTGSFLEESQGPSSRLYYHCKLAGDPDQLFKQVASAPGINIINYEISLEDGRKSQGQFTLNLQEVSTEDVHPGPAQDFSDESCSSKLEERICKNSWY